MNLQERRQTSDLYVERGSCLFDIHYMLASRSDVLEWLGELTRREKLELLEWDECGACGGEDSVPAEGAFTLSEFRKLPDDLADSSHDCPNCLDGLVPPASQVEAHYQAVIEWIERRGVPDRYGMRAALIAAMEGVGE